MMQTDVATRPHEMSWGHPPTDWPRVPRTHATSLATPPSPTERYEHLPRDPRSWSRDHVALWLAHVVSRHVLPPVPTDRFPMNGKALCLMSVDMFLQRVPLGGKLLYKDFQLRLGRAMHLSS